MATRNPSPLSRRRFLWLCLAAPTPFVLAACSGPSASSASSPAAAAPPGTPGGLAPTRGASAPTPPAPTPLAPTGTPPAQPAQQLQPTPACTDAEDVTPAQTEGPYFKPDSPLRTSLLESGIRGTKLVVTGQVVSRDCQPVARALLDFWQADGDGVYDNAGYKLRGHQFTDEAGRYTLETVFPGLYPGRTRHIHVKVQAPNQPVLTTQLYFPGEARNASDSIFHPALLMTVRDSGDGRAATFTFAVNA